MRIGIIELEAYPAISPWENLENLFANKQTSSLTPQAISVWCRQMGHETFYTTYIGFGDPRNKLPKDLDVVFISSPTYLAPLAYGLSRAFQLKGTLTVTGGAHARSFPADSLRYFDLVVQECDKGLIADIIAGEYAPGQIISSPHPFSEVPSIEARLGEIRKSTFPFNNRTTFIPMVSSTGCPYDCNFCIDWDSRYRQLSLERLAADLHFASRTMPGAMLTFHDPNFGLRFDEVMDVFESLPPGKRNPYGIECTLSILRPDRMQRLKDTNCTFLLPSVESWNAEYGNKIGVGKISHDKKLRQVIEKFKSLEGYVPYLGTNFIFGLDADQGDTPFELTKEFIWQSPFVWAILHIPIPFGGTPLHNQWLQEDRILKSLPFMFYKVPYLAVQLKNYDPVDYFRKMADLFAFSASPEMLRRRRATSPDLSIFALNYFRTGTARQRARVFSKTADQLQHDAQYRSFHLGQSEELPDTYVDQYRRRMGKYAELLPLAEARRPDLSSAAQPVTVRTP